MTSIAEPRDPVVMPSDEDLCRAVRDGDTGAFELLYRRHAEWARTRAARYLNAADAEDATAEVFAALLGALRRGRGPEGAVRPYLLTALRHQASRALSRSRQSTPTGDLTELPSPADPRDDLWVPSVEDQVIASSDGTLASSAFAMLRPLDRRAIELADIEGRSYREAAEELGVREGAFGRRLHLARRALFDAWLAQHIPAAPDDAAHPSELDLARYLTGNGGPRIVGRAARHLDTCAGCQLRVAALDVEQQRRPRRVAGVGALGLLGIWWRLRAQRLRLWHHLSWAAGAKAGAAVVVLGSLTAALLVPAVLAQSESAAPGSVTTVVPSPARSISGPATVAGSSAQWLPGATLSAAQAGEVVLLPFRIAATGDSGGPLTLSITAGPGTTIEDQYQACTRRGATVTCPRIGPLSAGDQIDGVLAVRVDDPAVAALPTLSLTR
ncbi:sigma-70 family RNA polymerase sigma factor [Cellulomonas sp. NPDC089187]|uniref:RNA polymerase sigma factor n=1 Tax=Cellulomonas sp. NPDC089187 TaxID=3154970 RepID=UPI00342A6364